MADVVVHDGLIVDGSGEPAFRGDIAIEGGWIVAVGDIEGAQAPRTIDAEGRILTKNWELYDAQHVVFQPKHMSVEELQQGIESAWKHAYSYQSIWRRVRSSPAPWPVRLGTNLGYRFYANNLSRFYNCDWIIGRAPRYAPMPAESEPASIAS